jgi:glycosyltransferase involved in cell wall biosynthesis
MSKSECSNNKNINFPLVTLALFTYNQEQFVKDAIDGIFSQTYPNLEIIISDDKSTDSTLDVIKKTVNQHKNSKIVIIRQNYNNLGLSAHVNKVMEIASGEIIVVAAGDDISLPNRVSTIVSYWIKTGKSSGSIFSRFKTIEKNGIIKSHNDNKSIIKFSINDRDGLNTLGLTIGTSGCTQAWSKDMFDIFGPIDPKILHEDITIPLRALMIGSVSYLPDELVVYRVANGTISRPSYANYKERFAKMARYWEGRVANYKQYENDILIISNYENINKEDLDWLSLIVKKQAAIAYQNYRFFSGGFKEKMRIIADGSVNIGIVRRIKMLAITALPRIYGIKKPW